MGNAKFLSMYDWARELTLVVVGWSSVVESGGLEVNKPIKLHSR